MLHVSGKSDFCYGARSIGLHTTYYGSTEAKHTEIYDQENVRERNPSGMHFISQYIAAILHVCVIVTCCFGVIFHAIVNH